MKSKDSSFLLIYFVFTIMAPAIAPPKKVLVQSHICLFQGMTPSRFGMGAGTEPISPFQAARSLSLIIAPYNERKEEAQKEKKEKRCH